jgi:hypothetical protein
MPQRIFFIVVVLIFLPFGEILGQQKNVENFSSTRPWLRYLQANSRLQTSTKNVKYFLDNSGVEKPGNTCINTLLLSSPFPALSPVSPAFYVNSLDFFCRKELQIEKAIALPLRFRLGSLQYTDYLEGKSHSIIGR